MPAPSPRPELMHAVFDAAGDGMLVYSAVRDSRRRIAGFRAEAVNRKAEQILREHGPVSRVLKDMLPDRARDDVFVEYAGVAAAGGSLDFTKTFEDEQGGVASAWQFSACALNDGLLVTLRDATAQTKKVRHILQERAFLRIVATKTSELVSLHDSSGFTLAASAAAASLLDIDAEALVGAHLTAGLHDEDREALLDGDRLRVPCTASVRRVDAGGSERWLQVRLSERRDKVVAVTRDVTRLEHLERRIQELAPEDSLTGLANRAAFVAQLTKELDRRRRYGRPLSIVAVRADGLTEIRNNYGSDTVNRAIKILAERTVEVIRTVDMAGRWTDEVFLLLLPETPAEGALRAAERLQQALSEQPIRGTNPPILVTACAGITDAEWTDEPATLLRRAASALKAARARGPGTLLTARAKRAA